MNHNYMKIDHTKFVINTGTFDMINGRYVHLIY